LRETKFQIKTANGIPIECKGTVTFSIKLGKCQWRDEFFILTNLAHPIILGNKTMKKRGINIDFIKAQISIQCNHRISIVPFSNVTQERGTLHVCEDVSLPTTCERLVECTISNGRSCPKDDITVYVHTWEAASEKLGIRVAKGLGVIKNNKITIGLSNFATGTVNLKKGTVIASYEEVNEKDWSVFDLDSKPVKHINAILSEFQFDKSDDLPQELNIGSSQSKLSENQLNDLIRLIRKHKKVFAKDTDNPGQVKRDIAEHSIVVENAKPISEGPRRTSPHNRQVIRDAVKKNDRIRYHRAVTKSLGSTSSASS